MVDCRQRRDTKAFLVEQQGGACLCCGAPIHADRQNRRELFRRDSGDRDAGVLPTDPSLPRTKENGYAACNLCVGAWDGKMSLEELRAYVRTPKVKKEKTLVENPATIPAIEAELAKLIDKKIYVPKAYRFAPLDKAPNIARSLANRELARQQSRYPHHAAGAAKVGKAMRQRLLGEQNFRCAYDGYLMNIHVPNIDGADGPRTATVEHVIQQADGGSNDYDNLVMACKICNNYRASLQMSAEEFAEFIQQNPTFIEERIKDIETGANKIRQKQRKNQKRAARRASHRAYREYRAAARECERSGQTAG